MRPPSQFEFETPVLALELQISFGQTSYIRHDDQTFPHLLNGLHITRLLYIMCPDVCVYTHRRHENNRARWRRKGKNVPNRL